MVVASRAPLVTREDGRRPLFPERQEDTYRRLLLRRVSDANAMLLTKIGPVLRRLSEDINARAEARRDTMSEDLSILLRVIDEAEDSFERRNEPKASEVEAVGAQVDRFTAAQVARTLKRVATIDVTRGGLLTETIEGWATGNVKLIKTIDARYFDDIRKVTTEALRTGRSTRDLIKDFQARYSVSKSRAEVIARDQIGTLNSQLTQERQTSLGVTKYIWRTLRDERVRGRPGGKYPNARPSHWERDGREYEWAKPPSESEDDGAPGEPIQCFPGDTPIGLTLTIGPDAGGIGVHAAFRREYAGDLVRVVAGGAEVRCTPNHPFMCARGWVGAGDLRPGDVIFRAQTVDDIAASAVWDVFVEREGFQALVSGGSPEEFHGDGARAPVWRLVAGERGGSMKPHVTLAPSFAWTPVVVESVHREALAAPIEVFNFSTSLGWYVAGGFVVSNCRCTAEPVLP